MKKVSLNLCLFGEEGGGDAAIGSAEGSAEIINPSGKENIQMSSNADTVKNSDSSAAPVGGKEENEKTQQSEMHIETEKTDSFEGALALPEMQESALPSGTMRIIQNLAAIYNLQETDIDAIADAFSRTQTKNALEERLHRRSAAKQYQALLKEAEVLSEKIRGFDLNAELEDNRFCSLLRCGFSMEEAWQAVHMNQLLCAAARQASEKGAKEAVERYRQGTARPEENGVKGQSGIARKTSVEHLTGRGIRDILRRVEKGAKVKF